MRYAKVNWRIKRQVIENKQLLSEGKVIHLIAFTFFVFCELLDICHQHELIPGCCFGSPAKRVVSNDSWNNGDMPRGFRFSHTATYGFLTQGK